MKPGTLLLLEHVASSQHRAAIQSIIQIDKALYTQLWPRSGNDINLFVNDPSEDVEKVACKKCNKNIFNFGQNYVVGNIFCKFNHSCKPNCHMGQADKLGVGSGIQSDVNVYAMWLHKNVQSGDELTIDYTNGQQHVLICEQFGIQCTCNLQDIQDGLKRSAIQTNLDSAFRLQNEKIINGLVDAYMKRSEAFKAIRIHEMAEVGIFITSNGRYMCVPSICRHMNTVDNVDAKIRHIDKRVNYWKSIFKASD